VSHCILPLSLSLFFATTVCECNLYATARAAWYDGVAAAAADTAATATADETPADDTAATAIVNTVVSRPLAKLLFDSVAEEAKKIIAADAKASKAFLASDDATATATTVATAVASSYFDEIGIDDDKYHFPTDDDGADDASRPMPPLKTRVENRSEFSDDDDDDNNDEDEDDGDDENDDEEDSESGSGDGGSTDGAMNISVDLLDSSLDIEDEAGPVVPVVPGYKVDHGVEELYKLSQAMGMLHTCQDYNRQFE